MTHDRLIVIEGLTETRDSYGGVIATWATVATVWAKVPQLTGREYWTARTVSAEAEALFEIRPGFQPAPKTHRIVHDGDTYDITSVSEIGRGRGWQVRGKAKNDE